MKTLILFLITALLLPSASFAATADEIAEKLQSAYEATKDMKADFTQVSTVKAMNMKREGSGTLIIKKPGLLRYSYAKPEEQELIVKGEDLIMYTPSTNTVVKRKLERAVMDRTPSTFLAGLGRITDSFTVSFPPSGEKDKQGDWRLLLKPKGESMGVKEIVVETDPESFVIKSFSFTETSGNTTAITLTKIKTNAGVKEGAFDFRIPKGANLVAE